MTSGQEWGPCSTVATNGVPRLTSRLAESCRACNNESAGKHSSGTTRPGDPWLKSVLGQAAISASRGKDTYLAARYRRLMARRGRKRALVALQHSILIAVWHMFTNDTTYCDLGANYLLERAGKARATRRLIGQLNHLGYQVTINPLAAT